jgi:hypothetical protein
VRRGLGALLLRQRSELTLRNGPVRRVLAAAGAVQQAARDEIAENGDDVTLVVSGEFREHLLARRAALVSHEAEDALQSVSSFCVTLSRTRFTFF